MTLTRRLILAFALMAGIAPAFAQVPPPVPALPDTERRTTYSISASTCACSVGFALYGDSTDYANWLTVWVNSVQIPQDGNWTITSPSGSLATLARPITDAVLTFTNAQTGTVQIVGARRPRRTSQLSENQGVAARDMNQVLSDLEAQVRELWDRQARTVQAPPGDTLNLLPVLASRQNQGVCFDNGGNLASCVGVPSSSLIAGNGILLTGVAPTTISNNIAAGAGITITGTNPLTIANNISAGPGISITGTNPKVIATSRQYLTTATAFYVTKTGSDSNLCTVGAPCLTIQRAINYIAANIDGGSNDVTISVGDGTYAESLRIYFPLPGIRFLFITGNTATPANVALTGNGSDTFQMNQPSAFVVLAGMTISAGTGANSDCVHVSGGTVQISTGVVFGSSQQNHFDADGSGTIAAIANYSITGATGSSHWSSSFGGFISAVGITITMPSPVLFGAAFAAAADMGKIQAISLTFSGTSNGQRYVSTRNSSIFTNGGGATYLPGNSGGAVTTGGQYN